MFYGKRKTVQDLTKISTLYRPEWNNIKCDKDEEITVEIKKEDLVTAEILGIVFLLV